MAATGIVLRRSNSKADFKESTKLLRDGELVFALNDNEFGFLKDGNNTNNITWGRLENELPTGGLAGQTLIKSSANNYEVEWGSSGGGGSHSGVEDPNIAEAIESFGEVGDSYNQLPKPNEIVSATFQVIGKFHGRQMEATNLESTMMQDADMAEEFSEDYVGDDGGGLITAVQAYATNNANGEGLVNELGIYIKTGSSPINGQTATFTDGNETVTILFNENDITIDGGISIYEYEYDTDNENQTTIPDADLKKLVKILTNFNNITDTTNTYSYTTDIEKSFPYQEWYKKDLTTWIKKPTTQRIVNTIPTDISTADDAIGTVYFVI